jgi:hypothetical protein
MVILIAAVAGAQEDGMPMDLPAGKNAETKDEEEGILATMLVWYMKAREFNKLLYDEIMYWESMREDWDALVQWYNEQKETLIALRDSTIALKEDFVVSTDYLQRIQHTVGDPLEDMATQQASRFNAIVRNAAQNVNAYTQHSALAGHAGQSDALSTVQGMMVPGVQQTLRYVDSLLPTSGVERMNRESAIEAGIDYLSNRMDINVIRDCWPNERMKNVSQCVLANAMATSSQISQWSTHALEQATAFEQRLDETLGDDKSVNEHQLIAAHYALLSANQNNKEMIQTMQELKVFSHMVGEDVFSMAQCATVQMDLEQQTNEFVYDGLQSLVQDR